MNVYESIPTMEKGEIRLRPVMAEDEVALLRVYGDPLALPFFNSDNCHDCQSLHRQRRHCH